MPVARAARVIPSQITWLLGRQLSALSSQLSGWRLLAPCSLLLALSVPVCCAIDLSFGGWVVRRLGGVAARRGGGTCGTRSLQHILTSRWTLKLGSQRARPNKACWEQRRWMYQWSGKWIYKLLVHLPWIQYLLTLKWTSALKLGSFDLELLKSSKYG